MKKFDWTKSAAIAEILSAIAIVVTLLYLADQTNEIRVQTEQNNRLLQQDQNIALSLRAETRATSAIELANMTSEYPEIWRKGLAGEQLDETDQIVFGNLMQGFNDTHVFASEAAFELGYESASNYWVVSYGLFLSENPGAKAWHQAHYARMKEVERISRGGVILGDDNIHDRIQAVWKQIERAEDPGAVTK